MEVLEKRHWITFIFLQVPNHFLLVNEICGRRFCDFLQTLGIGRRQVSLSFFRIVAAYGSKNIYGYRLKRTVRLNVHSITACLGGTAKLAPIQRGE